MSNEVVLNNIRLIAELGKAFQIRIPLIVGVNADDDNLHATARFLTSLPAKNIPVNLLPYHDAGKDKHLRRNTTYNPNSIQMSTPTDEQLQHCIDIFSGYGVQATVGG
ncbi:MAG: hypothetical protein J5486_04760 [Bacteroidaceae bacterium]|nr:hypothetical protein [Bacteroidaceae bacterium]